jgi:hypothetical protein
MKLLFGALLILSAYSLIVLGVGHMFPSFVVVNNGNE